MLSVFGLIVAEASQQFRAWRCRRRGGHAWAVYEDRLRCTRCGALAE